MTRRPTPPLIEFALLLLLASLWGASYSFIKIGVATIPPISFIAARTLIAGAILGAIILASGVRIPRERATWGRFLAQACLNSVIPFTLIAWAERSVDAGLAAILNSTTPIFAFLLSLAFLRGERVTARRLFGVVAGLVGICLVIGVDALRGLGQSILAQGAIVAATLCYGAAALYGRGFKSLAPIVPAAGSLICGAAILIPFSLAIDRPWTLAPSRDSLLALAALAIFSTALAFTIYFRLIHTLGSVPTTAQAYLRVPIGVGIGVAALGETPSPTAWIGLVFVVLGVAAMTLPERPAAALSPSVRG